MPASLTSFMSPQSHPQRATPKLSCRNSSPSTSSIAHCTSDFKNNLSTDNPITTIVLSVPSSPLDSQHGNKPRLSDYSIHNTTCVSPHRSSTSSSKTRSSSSSSSHRKPLKECKTIKSSFFRFFGVKEPSTQAWIEYQQTIQKQQARKGKRTKGVVGIPMVSSAQLPSTVPKVNSKWDGLPEARKEKEKTSQSPSNTIKSSANSTSTELNLERSSTRLSAAITTSLRGLNTPSPAATTSVPFPSLRDYPNTRALYSTAIESYTTQSLSSQSSYSFPELPPYTSATISEAPDLFDAGNLMGVPTQPIY